MYPVNYLSLQAAQQLFLAVARLRIGQGLVGVRDGSNHIFRLPGGTAFEHNLPFITICVYTNGMRLALLDDYVIQESAGPGTGYDTVVLESAPYANDHLLADYVVR